MAGFPYLPSNHYTLTHLLRPLEAEEQPGAQEVRNERALFVYNRVQHKLTGKFPRHST